MNPYSAPQSPAKIPPHFANVSTKIGMMSEKINLGDEVICLGGKIKDPSHFYVNLYQTWNDLESFMKWMQAIHRTMLQNRMGFEPLLSVPNPNLLVLGLYVSVWYQTEWHRGQITKRQKDGTFQIFIIDFGDLVDHVKQIDIRYLMTQLCEFPIQAIHVRLLVKNNRREEIIKKDWTPKQAEDFCKMMFDHPIHVIFKSNIREGIELVWSINMNILEKGEGVNVAKILLNQEEIEKQLMARKISINSTQIDFDRLTINVMPMAHRPRNRSSEEDVAAAIQRRFGRRD